MNIEFDGNRVQLTITGDELQRFERNESLVWHTPGSQDVYTASRPRWQYDVCIANPLTFLYINGFSDSEGLEEQELTILVDLT